MAAHSLFVPGWGAPPRLYASGLPSDWETLEPPSFAASGGSLAVYRRWLGDELRRRGRSALAGHSMGAALSILAAANAPDLIERLVLVAPAGLPLDKPMWRSLLSFLPQAAGGLYPRAVAMSAASAALRAPRAALAVAHEVRRLDLRSECARIRKAAIPVLVVGCSSDTLVTSDHARTLADALGAEYHELELPGGHMWMLSEHRMLAGVLG